MNLKKLLFVFLLHLCYLQSTQAQMVKTQFINNCADVSITSMDVYVNGVLAVDNLNFRNSSGFIDYPVMIPGNTITIGLAPATSTLVTDTFFSVTKNITSGDPHVMVINGVKSSTGYSPLKKIEIDVFSTGKTSASIPTNTDFAFGHGCTDLGTIDVRSGLSMLAGDLSFSNFTSGYNIMPTADFKIRVTNASGSKTLYTYNTAFAANALNNVAGMIITSGFVNPANNSNGPSFGLWMSTNVAGQLIPLPTATPEAISRVQFINNCADTAADTVDLYIDGIKLIDDFAFRTANAVEEYLSKTPITIAVAPQNSSSVADAFYTLPISLDSLKNYVFVANGIKSVANYNPIIPYTLNYTKTWMEDAANSANTDIMFMQGSTDAPQIDIKQSTTTLFSGASYASFSGYQSIPTANTILRLTAGATMIDYDGDFSTFGMQGQAVTLLASGFMDQSKNSKGPAFGLYVTSANGGQLKKLNVNTTGITAANAISNLYHAWPNPVTQQLHIAGPANAKLITADVLDITGKVVLSKVGVTDNTINVSSLNSGNYILHFTHEGQPVDMRFIKQ